MTIETIRPANLREKLRWKTLACEQDTQLVGYDAAPCEAKRVHKKDKKVRSQMATRFTFPGQLLIFKPEFALLDSGLDQPFRRTRNQFVVRATHGLEKAEICEKVE